MKKVAFYTLGCKLNFHETAYMEEQFEKAGYKVVPFSEKADVYVINTCTVTKTADAKSRKAIRKAKHLNPESLVVVTGCYSEVYPEEVGKIEEADLITGNVEKFRLVDLVEKRLKGEIPRVQVAGVWKVRKVYPLGLRHFEGKTRAFLKVQQGCELFCSYCIIPKARGPSLSLLPTEVVRQARELADAGYKEIVLTGTHLGGYGRDLGGNWNLARLLKELVKIPNLRWIRLSSVEPFEFTEELIELITSSEKIAPHFHIPLQSGSETVLQRMKRRYSPKEYAKLIEEIVKKRPESCIGTDVMVGFPLETEEEFEETKKFVEELPFAYLHVFPYSERKGTVAERLGDTVPPEVKRERALNLREIGRGKNLAFRKSFLGKELEGISLSESEGKTRVLTGNYINVFVEEKVPPGELVKVRLEKVGKEREENYGRVVG